MQNKIDIVIAWVDGNDPAHKIKRQKYLNSQQSLSSVEDTRFASNDEIYYNFEIHNIILCIRTKMNLPRNNQQ